MCNQCEHENNANESVEEQAVELTPEQLESLLVDEGNINIPELLETEMVTSRTLYLSEEITLDTINHIIMLIHKYNRDDYGIPVEDRIPIKLYIDSGGGELYRSLSVCSAIESSETPVIGIGLGLIASGALLIYLSTHYKYLSRFSTVMYHTLIAGMTESSLNEMNNTVNHYNHTQDKIDDYIVEKTGIPRKKLKKKREQNLDWFIKMKHLTKYKFYDELID